MAAGKKSAEEARSLTTACSGRAISNVFVSQVRARR